MRMNPTLTARIGENIRRARFLAGDMTQQQLAHLIDEWTTNSAVSRWERGKARPLDRTLERIGEITGQDFEWFFADHPDEAAA
jgi:transcriptional regulator with XRE-family HTH domain